MWLFRGTNRATHGALIDNYGKLTGGSAGNGNGNGADVGMILVDGRGDGAVCLVALAGTPVDAGRRVAVAATSGVVGMATITVGTFSQLPLMVTSVSCTQPLL